MTVVLDAPTRDGNREIRVFTNLPAVIPAARVAEVDRPRWSVEAAFGGRAAADGPPAERGPPRAALFAFAVAPCSPAGRPAPERPRGGGRAGGPGLTW